MAPGIAAAACEHFELTGVGIETPDASAVQADDTVRRLNVRVGVNGLVHVDVPVVTPAQRVQIVVRVLRAKTGEDDSFLIRLAVAVGVFEIKQLMAGSDVTTAVAVRQHAGGNEEALGEHGGFVGLAIAVPVLEDNDGIGGRLAGFDLRINLRTGDPETALRIPVDFNRFVQLRVLGPEIDLETVGHIEGRQGLERSG